jgi:RNA polymerase sigma-70 factor (ECF subfamily)
MDFSRIAENAVHSEKDFRLLYDHFYGKVFGYVYSRIDNKADAEDVNAEVWMKIVQHLKSYDKGKAQIQTWIFTIVRNAITDYLRKQRLKRFLFISMPQEAAYEDTSYAEIENKAFLRMIQEKLPLLSPKQRECIRLKYFSDLQNKDIAVIMKISEKTVASNLSRGLEKLTQLCNTVIPIPLGNTTIK